jgi:hypothetical protein
MYNNPRPPYLAVFLYPKSQKSKRGGGVGKWKISILAERRGAAPDRGIDFRIFLATK